MVVVLDGHFFRVFGFCRRCDQGEYKSTLFVGVCQISYRIFVPALQWNLRLDYCNNAKGLHSLSDQSALLDVFRPLLDRRAVEVHHAECVQWPLLVLSSHHVGSEQRFLRVVGGHHLRAQIRTSGVYLLFAE